MIVSPVIFTEKIASVYTFFHPSVKRGKSGSILPKNGLLGLRSYVKKLNLFIFAFFAVFTFPRIFCVCPLFLTKMVNKSFFYDFQGKSDKIRDFPKFVA